MGLMGILTRLRHAFSRSWYHASITGDIAKVAAQEQRSDIAGVRAALDRLIGHLSKVEQSNGVPAEFEAPHSRLKLSAISYAAALSAIQSAKGGLSLLASAEQRAFRAAIEPYKSGPEPQTKS